MRAKRSKQYKKLVQQFQLHHGFREPYQVLVDGDLVRDSHRFAMDLQAGLERTLHGKVKIMITQCCIRHLYAQARSDPSVYRAIDLAKTFERRRCGHRPEEFEEPLSKLACLSHVVDEKGRGENKHRYVVASQEQEVRRHMRGIAGVPLIYISRSVMIMEPMSQSTARIGAQAERAKFRSELRQGEKRKREEKKDASGSDSDSDSGSGSDADKKDQKDQATEPAKKKKKTYGPKGPNPLAVKKKKTATSASAASTAKNSTDGAPKKKRIRKPRAKTGDGAGTAAAAEAGEGAEE